MTLDELLNLDISDVNRLAEEDPKELRRLTSRLNAVAAKRVKRLEKTGLKTPSYAAFNRGGGVKTIRGKDIQAVKSQFGKVRQFLSSGQSTVTQARQFQAEVRERLGISDLNEDQEKRFWSVYDKLKESGATLNENISSGKIIQYLRDLAKDEKLSVDDMLDRAIKWLNDQYESAEYEELAEIGGGVSGFFNE